MIIASETTTVNNADTAEDAKLSNFLSRHLAVLWKDWPKSMIITVHSHTGNLFALSGDCPHCFSRAVFNMVTSAYEMRVSDARSEVCAGMQCPGCLRFILAVVDKGKSEGE